MRLHRQHEQRRGVHISGLGSQAPFETTLTMRLPAYGAASGRQPISARPAEAHS